MANESGIRWRCRDNVRTIW